MGWVLLRWRRRSWFLWRQVLMRWGARSRFLSRSSPRSSSLSARRAPATVAGVLAGSAVVLPLTALFSCSVGPTYSRPSIDVPSRWAQIDKASTAPAIQADEPQDLGRWWKRLGDPVLSDLIEEGLHDCPDLRQAAARLREARARRLVAGGARYPTLSASASASRRQSTGKGATGPSATQLSSSLDASFELDVFGGVRRSVEAATADEDASRASLAAAHVSLVAEIARTYFEFRSLALRLGIARTNLASQTETLELTELRAKAGLVSIQDVERARSNREQTLARIPSLTIGLIEAEHRLDVLLGKNPGSLHARLDTTSRLLVMPSEVAVGIPADTLRQRPDVRAAERKLAAETARVGVAVANQYPSFRLSGSIGIEAITQSATSNGVGGLASLLGGITAPIFQGGRLRAQVEVQDALREQAEIAYQKVVLGALEDVENALVALVHTRERELALTRATEAGRNAATLARQRYAAGVIDFESVLDAERTVLSLEDELASTRTDGVLTLVRLYEALGGGWDEARGDRADDEEHL